MKERDRSFDIAKGIGILCVILGHMDNSRWACAVFTFHTPLFFVISGCFLDLRSQPGPYFLKRCRALLPAYLFTSLCLCLLNILTSLSHGCDASTTLHKAAAVLINALYGSGTNVNRTPWGIRQIGAIWFLPAMIWACSLVNFTVHRCKREPVRFAVVFIVFLLCCLSAKRLWLPFSLQAGGCAALYVYSGWAVRHYLAASKMKADFERYKKYFIALGAVCWLFSFTMAIYPRLARASFPYFPTSVLTSLAIVAGLLLVSPYLDRLKGLSRVLCFYGRNTLPLLCFHLMELDYFPWKKVYSALFLHRVGFGMADLIVFVLKVALCTALTLLAARIPALRRVFRLPAPVKG